MAVPPARRQPTLEEVALRAGVSRSAASRAINSAVHISPAKRAAVERAIRELGYVPNLTARALASKHVGAVVLAASNDNPALFADPFFGQVIAGVTSALEKTDLDLKLLLSHPDGGHERVQRMLRAPRADGIMVMALRGDDPLNSIVASTGLPVVFGGRPPGGDPTWFVDADNRGGARVAAEHLIGIGRRRIATIAGPPDTHVAAGRLAGFNDALSAAGLNPTLAEHADFTQAGGAAAMQRLLKAMPTVDGVFAASDNMAAGALQTLRSCGLAVPADVAVVGFDDLPVAQLTDPTLTTVHQPIKALGYEMARMLIAILAGEQPNPLLLPTRLVVRDSAPLLLSSSPLP